MTIPESKFATYCDTVLKPLYEYLETAQVIHREDKTVICHGGLCSYIDGKALLPNETILNQFMPERDKSGFLKKYGNVDLNSLLAADQVSEINGRVPACDLENLSSESFGGRGVQLVIVGHTPTTLGVPRFLNLIHPFTGDRKWLLQLDTQYTDRTTNHSCTAFNMDGHFISYYTFQHEKQNVTAMIYSEDVGVPMPKDMGEPGRTYSYNGRVTSKNHKGMGVYVSCVPSMDSKNHHPNIKLVRARKVLTTPPLKETYNYYTWGDVEGSTTFLKGCQALCDSMKKQGYLNSESKYVSIGDVLGQPRTPAKTGVVSDAETVAFANKAAIKIIGNRDLNKLRIPAEFLHATERKNWPKEKGEMVSNTYPFTFIPHHEDPRLKSTWMHHDKKQWSEGCIVDAYAGEILQV